MRPAHGVRRRLGAAALVAALVAIGVYGAQGRHSRNEAARAATTTRAASRVLRLSPPAPIPGYLLIADRGNDRMLLVDGEKRVLWEYPRPGRAVPLPFRFDDDTFFGPVPDRIISNQEDQHTIQVI